MNISKCHLTFQVAFCFWVDDCFEPTLPDAALVANVGNPECYWSSLLDDMRVHSKNLGFEGCKSFITDLRIEIASLS